MAQDVVVVIVVVVVELQVRHQAPSARFLTGGVRAIGPLAGNQVGNFTK